MNKKLRLIHFIVSILFIIVMIIFQKYYRPWIYSNHIFDFYLADTFTNLFGEGICFFFISSLFAPQYISKPIPLLLQTSAALILYELAGLIFEKGLCDYKDIIATVIGALFAYLINRFFIKYFCFC